MGGMLLIEGLGTGMTVKTHGKEKAASNKPAGLVFTNWRKPISVASFCNIIYLSVFAIRQEKTPGCWRESTFKELKMKCNT